MAKSLCRLLMLVNYVLVVNFNVANMSLNVICENNILAKTSEYTTCDLVKIKLVTVNLEIFREYFIFRE